MDEPITLGPGEGEGVKADRPELSLLEVTFDPGSGVDPHLHKRHSDSFFVLEGEVEVGIHRDGQVVKRTLGYRDMIVVPAGVPRSLKNNGDKDALFCVVIGAQKPQVPTYPETSAMHGISRV